MNNLKKIIYLIITFTLLTSSLYGEIKDGLFDTVGNKAITHSDIISDVPKLANKIIKLRIFNDQNHKMNLPYTNYFFTGTLHFRRIRRNQNNVHFDPK